MVIHCPLLPLLSPLLWLSSVKSCAPIAPMRSRVIGAKDRTNGLGRARRYARDLAVVSGRQGPGGTVCRQSKGRAGPGGSIPGPARPFALTATGMPGPQRGRAGEGRRAPT